MTSTPLPSLPKRRAPRPTRRFATARTVLALMLREMSTRYGRSPGGYVWALLEPLGAILVMGLAFSLVMRTPSLGTSFILFYATAYMPFHLYQSLSLLIARALMFSKPLLRYPAVTWVDAIVARLLLNLLTGVLVAYILLTGILAVTDTRTVIDLGPVVLGMALAALLGLGVGVMNCVLIGLFPFWDLVWSMATRPLFLASGIFFLYDNMPQMAQTVLWYNPLIHITSLSRTGYYPMYAPQYISIPYVLFFSLIPLALGLILLGRYHRDILNN